MSLGTDPSTPLWSPQDHLGTRTSRFRSLVNRKYGLSLSSYEEFYKWSIDNIADFWSTVWDETGVVGFKGDHIVDSAARPSDNPSWFSQAKLNWAENMLRDRSTHPALISVLEPTLDNPNPPVRKLAYGELYSLVADIVSALLLLPIQPGDRVASYSSNSIVHT